MSKKKQKTNSRNCSIQFKLSDQEKQLILKLKQELKMNYLDLFVTLSKSYVDKNHIVVIRKQLEIFDK